MKATQRVRAPRCEQSSNPTVRPRTEALVIEFGCGGISRDGGFMSDGVGNPGNVGMKRKNTPNRPGIRGMSVQKGPSEIPKDRGG
jgi:hypothetical protein